MSGEHSEPVAMSGNVERLCDELRDVVETIRRSELDRLAPSRGREVPETAAAARRALVDAADELAETLAQLEGTAWRTHPLRTGPR